MRAREEVKSSTESSSSSSSSPSPSVFPSDGGGDSLDGGASLVGAEACELNGLELRSPKPKPSLGESL